MQLFMHFEFPHFKLYLKLVGGSKPHYKLKHSLLRKLLIKILCIKLLMYVRGRLLHQKWLIEKKTL